MPEEHEYRGLTIKIRYDDYPESPREWDNLGTMVCWHNRHNLGDEQPKMDPMEWRKKLPSNGVVILPLYLYDHSGLTMNTAGFTCPWDSGQVGWIYVTHERIREEMARPMPLKEGQINPDLKPIKRVTQKDRARAADILRSEVRTYDQYLQGEVFGFIIERDGEELDSCWGFFGEEYCLEAAKEAADCFAQEEAVCV